MGIKIISDSAADIPEKIANELDITVLPLTITYNGENYKDGVDITSNEFFEKMANDKIKPVTSQVTPNEFFEVYKKEIDKGNQIISIHLSSKTSGTYQSADIAKTTFGDEHITIVDSKSLSYGYGLIVVIAAKMAKEGKNKQEILDKIDYLIDKSQIIFCVDDLEYLKRGGRISAAKAAIGELLSIKPILYITDGKIDVLDQVRGTKKVVPKIVELIEQIQFEPEYKIWIFHARCIECAADLSKSLIEKFGIEHIEIFDIGCVVGSHVGPGAYGVAFIKK